LWLLNSSYNKNCMDNSQRFPFEDSNMLSNSTINNNLRFSFSQFVKSITGQTNRTSISIDYRTLQTSLQGWTSHVALVGVVSSSCRALNYSRSCLEKVMPTLRKGLFALRRASRRACPVNSAGPYRASLGLLSALILFIFKIMKLLSRGWILTICFFWPWTIYIPLLYWKSPSFFTSKPEKKTKKKEFWARIAEWCPSTLQHGFERLDSILTIEFLGNVLPETN
jgi:hypothetical protein